ncbi:hypothetical protein BDN70DRAFT_880303 [Pholiota conissans]|uniref:Pre-rRNA-processing protein RIX1 n=1 Tax=Pholiota conissans TaxID=109636 RepID=A0A9P6CZ69_9AGAR|nr:hypothetical protein BDN70DRAFT_880303 [Pholiota conissans]
MDPTAHLKQLLQIQLATDSSAVRYLPYCLSTLTKESLQPSSHLTKWTTRIQSLLHSKDPGARWSGLCLAYKSSLLSQSLMIDSAQSWIGTVLPLLSRNEPLPTIKAAVRLLRVIFSTAIDITEFQRQVSLPHVVKFSSALIPLADSHPDVELKVLCMETLMRLLSLYPATHRASSASLSAFALRHLNGSPTGHTNKSVLCSASQLYATIPLTGGKVGAVNLWRKSLEETLAFGWEAFYSLRTTSLREAQTVLRPPGDEPQFSVPLNKDRLQCSISILCNLLRAIIERPVQVPIGNLIKYITALLTSSTDQEMDGFVDSSIRAMEISVIPDLWNAGCQLLICLTTRLPHQLDAHAGKLFLILARRLEQKLNNDNRLHFIQATDSLLKNCCPLHSAVLPARLARAILPSITKVFATASGTSSNVILSSSKSKNGKKRTRNYEGDEVFKTPRQIVCPTTEEENILLFSIDVLQSLFRIPNLSLTLQSVIARIITSILVALPSMSPASLSHDPCFIHVVNKRVQDFGLVIGAGTTSVMSKTLPFVIESALTGSDLRIQHDIELLLHPRIPPLVRSMPHVEVLSLFKAEEPRDEAEALTSLDLKDSDSLSKGDFIMHDDDTIVPSIPSRTPTTAKTFTTSPIVGTMPPKAASVTPPSHPLHAVANLSIKKGDTDIRSPPKLIGRSDSLGQTAITAPKGSSSRPAAAPLNQVEDDDEEMPVINMDSDSEEESVDLS